VMNAVSGHVYSFDAVDQLNRKTKNWKDLITSQQFKWSDIVVIQDPENVRSRQVASFHFIQQGQQQDVVANITNVESATSKEEKKEKIRFNAALERVYDEKKRLAAEKAEQEAQNAEVPAIEDATTATESSSSQPRKMNERFTSGDVAESFTSTATPLRTQNSLREMTDEEELQEIYGIVRKKKQKGYVRIVTSAGMLNIELHTDIVPRTTDNFMRLCDKDYFDNTIFHRLIQNFMIQGGDPTGTGKGGKSAFDDGRAFKDEFDSRLSHQGPGIVSMANSGKNTNRSQFFVTLKSCQHLDLKHSVFGRVVGGLNLLEVFNAWDTDEKDRPKKEIKLIRTEVFKNPFKEAIAEASKPAKEEKVVDPVATWFSNRRDPMEEHKNRNSSAVGKYMDAPVRPLPGEKRPTSELPSEELEYASIPQKAKKMRTTLDFSSW